MRRLMAFSVLLLTACVTTDLTPAGEKVRVTSNPDAVRGCTLVGEIVGRDRMNGGMAGQGAAEENAMRRMKNQAAEMGADTVLMVTAATGFSGSIQRGEGYRCNAATP
jgi:uncharacterized protein YbjQ (UPF0145 family)